MAIDVKIRIIKFAYKTQKLRWLIPQQCPNSDKLGIPRMESFTFWNFLLKALITLVQLKWREFCFFLAQIEMA